MNTFAKRFKEARNKRGLTQAQLADIAGVTQNTIHKIEKGETQKPRDILQLAFAMNVDPVWLQTGGEVLDGNAIGNISSTNSAITAIQGSVVSGSKIHTTPDNREHTLTTDDDIILDVLNVSASAGYGSINGDTVEIISQLRFAPAQFYQYYAGINPNNVRVINVKGDSMQPTFNNGDLLFVDITIAQFDGDGIYVFTFGDVVYVKRLQRTGYMYKVISDNKDIYDPWVINTDELDQLIIHGKVKVHQSQKLNFVG